MSTPTGNTVWAAAGRCGLAAVLFGAATPAAAKLGEHLSAFTLAGLLYLGAAIASAPFALRRRPTRDMFRIGGRRLALAVIVGGMLGPVLLMTALNRAPASSVSLLLNLEVVFTVAFAAIFFGEYLGTRVVAGMALVAGAGAAVGWVDAVDVRIGAVFAVAACAAWAIDNTVTANLDVFSPAQITLAKGMVAGTVNVTIGLMIGGPSLRPVPVVLALVVGAFGYGVSITLWISGARELGAARGQVIFAVAPFVGVVASWAVLGDRIRPVVLVAAGAAALGVALVVGSGHEHPHSHTPLIHEHAHSHDDGHHDHEHPGLADSPARHSHRHEHQALTHEHRHVPDPHHRHRHAHAGHTADG